MLKANYNEIIEKIKKETGLREEDINIKIDNKLKQLSDLISREGAAHIVANELNVKIIDLNKKIFKINELVAGIRNVEVLGKIVHKFDVREYIKNNKPGKVLSLILGDETGTIRAVAWDNTQIEILEKLNESDILKIKNAYVRENNGLKELHLNNKSLIIVNPEGEKIDKVLTKIESRRKLIKDLNENEFASIIGTIVQIFEPRFYEACPECNRKVNIEDGKYSCIEHGKVIEKTVPIINFFFDDGTDNLRVVVFRDMVAKILDVNEEELSKLREMNFDDLKNNVLGKQLVISGKTIKNTMFDRIEFIANSIEEVNALDIANDLLKEIR